MSEVRVVSVREEPKYKDIAIEYFQSKWANERSKPVYDDCISHCLTTTMPLPQWYLLMRDEKIVGCAGLISNDFISRMDLYPWICALYIEQDERGHEYGNVLLEKAREDARAAGYSSVYLATSHVGFYERYGFKKIAKGYHPWGADSDIFEKKTDAVCTDMHSLKE